MFNTIKGLFNKQIDPTQQTLNNIIDHYDDFEEGINFIKDDHIIQVEGTYRPEGYTRVFFKYNGDMEALLPEGRYHYFANRMDDIKDWWHDK